MPATGVTRSYVTVPAITLDKMSGFISDNISKSNALLLAYKDKGNYKGVASGGDRCRVPVMYEFGNVAVHSGFGLIDTTPPDGITDAFFDWAQFDAAIVVSDMQKFQTAGKEAIATILEARTQQAKAGLSNTFSRALLLGQASNDGSSLHSPYIDPTNTGANAASFAPIPLLVKYDPTTATLIGAIDQSANTWWRNQAKTSAATSYRLLLDELEAQFLDCSVSGGGAMNERSPDIFFCDKITYVLFVGAYHFIYQGMPELTRADYPFKTRLFNGAPVIVDDIVPDVANSLTNTNTKGTWYSLNTNFMGLSYDKAANFQVGEFVKPENQTAAVAPVTWRGTHWTNNRRKLGVIGNIARTLTAA